MRAIQKAQARIAESRKLSVVPRVMQVPVGGSSYFGQSYRWQEVSHFKYWAGIAIRCWQREVAGGEAPKLGTLTPKETEEKKTIAKCKSLGYDWRATRLELHKAAVKQAGIRRRARNPLNKAAGGPQEHEEFTAWESNHGIVHLFDHPNNLDCAADLWGYSVLFYLLTGELYWWIIRNDYGTPVEIWPIPSQWIVQKSVGNDGSPVDYIVQNPWGQMQRIPYDDVLPFYDLSPLNRYEGWSINQMIAEWVDAYETQLRSRLAQNLNGGIPAFHVALSDEYVDPDEAMLNRYYAKWFARFQGPDNAGKPLITGPGVEVKALGISPVDMDYVNSENQFRDMILAAYGVPKTIIGMSESMTYGSVLASQQQFCRFSVNPFLGMMGQRITHGLIRRTPHCEEGVCFWDDRVLDDPEQQRAEEQHLWDKGSLAPDELRNRHGMEPWPFGGDDPWLNGVQFPWATGAKMGDELDLDESMGRAERGQIEMQPVENAADDDSPLIIDKDEEAEPATKPEAKLRWFRTRDGDLSARGESGKWFIERKRRRDGKVGYILRHTKPETKDEYEFDADLACGILKDLAEKEEGKALGETSGASGGHAVPVEQTADQVQKALQHGLTMQEKQEHNNRVSDYLKRSGLILGRSMVIGNGRSTNGRH